MIGLGSFVALAGCLLASSALVDAYTGRVVGIMEGATVRNGEDKAGMQPSSKKAAPFFHRIGGKACG